MTDEDRRIDRVFERDDFTCQYCGDRAETERLRAHPIDAPSNDEPSTVAFVSVCEPCHEPLGSPSGGSAEATPSRRERFRALRAFTVAQSDAIGEVTAFVEVGTALPTALSAGEADPGTYARARRAAYLAFDLLDARLETVADTDGLDEDTATAVSGFHDAATALQADLRAVVSTIEELVVALGRCPVCLEPQSTEDGACSACATPEPVEPEAGSGEDFEALFRTVDDRLQAASASTERVTDRATVAAEALVG